MIKKIFFAALVLLFFIQPLVSQTSAQTSYLSIEQVTGQLEKKYGVRFFYRPEWFENRYFHSSVLDSDFNETLEKLKAVVELSIIRIDSGLYIFVPLKPLPKIQPAMDVSDVIIIGDQNEYGKYTKATISGRILDGMNDKPLPGASVVIDKLKLGAISDKSGNYKFEVPVGEYTVKLSFIGYEDNTRQIKLVGNGTLDLELSEKSIKLDEVIITSERAESNVHASQMSIIKLDSRSIKELPVAMGHPDIIKSITLMPGVQTIGELGTGFNVRGGGADQNLILLEDVPVFNSSHLLGLTSVVNSDGISNFTLYKAGIPAKYGERASSVMDIQMGVNSLDRTTVKGGIGIIDSRIYVETPLLNKKITLLVSARSSYSNWILHQMPDVDLMNSSASFYDANTLLKYNLNTRNKLSFFGYISNDKFGFSKNTIYNYSNMLASARWKHTFNNNLFFNLVAGVSNYSYTVTESDTSRPWEAYKIISSINYNNIKWNFTWLKVNNHAIDFGINSALYTVKPGNLAPLDQETIIDSQNMQQEKAIESAVYVSDNITISPKLTLDVGFRYSFYTFLGENMIYEYQPDLPKNKGSVIDSAFYGHNKPIVSYSGLEPRLSLRYNITDKSSVKVSYNRMYQYINLVSNTAIMTPSDVWKLSSPNLKPLMCDNFAIGFFHNYLNNNIETSVELYYKVLTNSIDYKNGAKILLNPYLETDLINAGGENYGIEFYLKKNSGRLTGWVSYTYSRAWLKTTGIFDEEKINNNEQFPSGFDKPDNLIINANYHISKRWRFGAIFTYSTGRPVTLPEYKFNFRNYQLLYFSDRNEYRLPDYHRLDVSLTFDESLLIRKKWKGSWTLSVINVYGRKNAYSVFYKKEDHIVSHQFKQYDMYKLYIIGRPFPSLTYNFTF